LRLVITAPWLLVPTSRPRHGVPQDGDLAGHVKALGCLGRLVDQGSVVLESLAGQPQASGVQEFQLHPEVTALRAGRGQVRAPLAELLDVRRAQGAGHVARRGLQQRRPGRLDRQLLEARLDRPMLDGLAGEQVGGPHQHPDRGAAPRQRCGHGRGHSCGPGIMNAPGEQHLQLPGGVGGRAVEELVDDRELCLPQREAGQRSDVTATLGALEHEPADARAQELPQQLGGRHVQERRDSGLLKLAGLGRPTAATMAQAGLISRTASSCAARSFSGTKPSTPTPHGRPSRTTAVSVSICRDRSPSARASAMNGIAPSAAMAAANSAWSLTRVIGPCATGSRTPRPAARGAPGASA
jgi:hypothetical protein